MPPKKWQSSEPRYSNHELGITADDWEWAARSLLGQSVFNTLVALVRKRARERKEKAHDECK